jgi:flagellin-like protein
MAQSSSPSSNIYTVLVFIAFLVVLAGVAYVWYRSYELTGTINPFTVGETAWRMLPTIPRLV